MISEVTWQTKEYPNNKVEKKTDGFHMFFSYNHLFIILLEMVHCINDDDIVEA